MERYWRSNIVKEVLLAALRMLLQRWLVLGGVSSPAALCYSPVRPYGQQETLLLCLPLGLFSSVLLSSQMGSLPTGHAGVSLMWGLPAVWRMGLSRKTVLCTAGSPLQTVLGPPLYLPFLHHPACLCLRETLRYGSPAPVFCLFFPHVSCEVRCCFLALRNWEGGVVGLAVLQMWQASSAGISITSKSGEELRHHLSDLKT